MSKGTTNPAPSASAAVSGPPRSIKVAFGAANPTLKRSDGFGATEKLAGRAFARSTAAAGVLEFELGEPETRSLTLVARATAVGDAGPPEAQKLTVRVNGKDAGTVDVGVDWTTATLRMDSGAWVAGKNLLELRSLGPVGGMVFERLWLEPTSARVELDLGESPAQAAVTSGWADPTVIARHSILRLKASPATLTATLRPTATDYAIAVVGRDLSPGEAAELAIKVNDYPVGSAIPDRDWGAQLNVVPADHMRPGPNVIRFETTTPERFALDRFALVPLNDWITLDVGEPATRVFLIDGFSSDEGDAEHNTCWSDAAASHLVVPLRPAPGSYRLTLNAAAYHPISPVVVKVRINGQLIASLEVIDKFEPRDLVVPPGRLVQGANQVEFAYSATIQPHSVNPQSGDQRDLAVRFDRIELAPIGK